ncbi:receptor-transporting protein 4-like isoform X1 [Arapaima gigas]
MTADWNPRLWMDTFSDLLEDEVEYDDSWTFQFNYSLSEELSTEERRRRWKIYCHCVHGRFRCSSCSRSWPSARVVLLFRYRLRSNRGTVLMRPFGQVCRNCCQDFELPGFSQREVEEALLSLFRKIRKNCYDEEDEDQDDFGSDCSERVWSKPHESQLCEACSLGIWCQED